MTVYAVAYSMLNIANIQYGLLLLTTVLLFLWWANRPKNLPPGPPSLPLVGGIPSLLWGFYKAGVPAYEYLGRNLKNLYGSVYSLDVCGQLVIFINDYQSIDKAFQDPRMGPNRPVPNGGIAEQSEQNVGMLLANGEKWSYQRRFTVTALRSFGVGKTVFADKIAEESKALADEFSLKKGKPFSADLLLNNATANVICSVIFGKRFEYNDESFQELLTLLARNIELTVSTSPLFFIPIMKYLPSKGREEYLSNINKIRPFVTKIIDEHKATFDSNNLRDYIDVYLDEILKEKRETGENELVTEKSLTATVIQMFTAGTDSTSLNLRWGLLYMIAHPEVQRKVQQELDRVVGRNRLPRLSDKSELPYFQASLLEITRKASTSRLSAMHSASEDATLNGYNIPKGSIVMANLWASHYDPKVFPKPEVFRPERFLNEKGDEVIQRKEHIPFSVGRRFCLGDNLARMELFIIMSHLLHQFTFTPPPSCDAKVGNARSPDNFKICAVQRD